MRRSTPSPQSPGTPTCRAHRSGQRPRWSRAIVTDDRDDVGIDHQITRSPDGERTIAPVVIGGQLEAPAVNAACFIDLANGQSRRVDGIIADRAILPLEGCNEADLEDAGDTSTATPQKHHCDKAHQRAARNVLPEARSPPRRFPRAGAMMQNMPREPTANGAYRPRNVKA